MSSELKGAFTGRQYVAGSMQTLDFVVDLEVGEIPIGTMPEGAVITGGWLQVLTAGSAASVLKLLLVDPSDGSTFATLATGDTVTVAKTDVVPDGIPGVKAYDLVISNAVLQTSGDGYVHLEYVVEGRSHFSEG